ncbi:MAG: hypothetical protein ACUVUQ_03495 [Thermodesulfovibrionales bacterium]
MKVLSLFISIFLFFVSPSIAMSKVIVHDIVVPTWKEVMLKVEVKGKLFKKGGEIVEFFVNGKTVGKSLTGGDGFAFKQFIPSKPAIYKVSARSYKEEGKGLLLSLRKGSSIVFVDVEGSLFESFTRKPRKESHKDIKEINKKLPVIFLKTSLMTMESVKEWLKKNGFADSPLILWNEGKVFSEFVAEGFKIKAVIGGSDVINSAKEHKPLLFSFNESEDAIEVNDWNEIKKRLIGRTKVKGIEK